MSAKPLCFSLLLAVSCHCASAGPVYKLVGPDGKITFSDKPSLEVPVDAYGASGPDAGKPVPEEAPVGFKVAEADATESRAEIRSAPSAAVESAVLGVLGIEDMVTRTTSLCAEAVPASADDYGAAVADWQSRNGALVARAHEILDTQFDPAAGSTLAAGLRANNDGMFAAVSAASAAARASWCDESFATMRDGKMDVRDNPKFAGPLGAP